MKKSISTLILLGISLLILIYILYSFHRVLNRTPVHQQEESLATTTITSDIDSDTVDLSNLTEDTTTAVDEPALTQTEELESSETEDTVPVDEQETLTQSAEDDEFTVEVTGTPGDIIRERPHLENALPPIPQAPPAPTGSPAFPSPVEEYFSSTGDSAPEQLFPTPIIESAPSQGGAGSFPAPITNSAPVSNQNNSLFPAPIAPSNTSPTGDTSQPSSSSFPAPLF